MGWLIAIGVLYLLFHGHRVHRNYYRRGLSITASMRGPWGTRISKRF
jgi:hypothetical protein